MVPFETMSQTTSARRPRAAARTLVFVGAVVAVVGIAGACSQARRSNGDSCIKDEDCLSSICAGGTCIASGPMLDAAYDADTGVTKSDAAEAGPESATGMDTSTQMEAAVEASPEASSEGSSPESSTDGSGDGAGD
jgi:hypothetical protein